MQHNPVHLLTKDIGQRRSDSFWLIESPETCDHSDGTKGTNKSMKR